MIPAVRQPLVRVTMRASSTPINAAGTVSHSADRATAPNNFVQFLGTGGPLTSYLSVGSISDYFVNVRVSCSDGPNVYRIVHGLQRPQVPVLGWANGQGPPPIYENSEGWTSPKGGPQRNCFIAGTQVLMAGGGPDESVGSYWGEWYADNRWGLAGLVLGPAEGVELEAQGLRARVLHGEDRARVLPGEEDLHRVDREVGRLGRRRGHQR